jgi:hypothetical protein
MIEIFMSTEIAAEDSGNYTCEVNGPLNTLLGVSTHCLYVRGTVVLSTSGTYVFIKPFNLKSHTNVLSMTYNIDWQSHDCKRASSTAVKR